MALVRERELGAFVTAARRLQVEVRCFRKWTHCKKP